MKQSLEADISEARCERWSAATLCRTARRREVLDYQGLTKVRSADKAWRNDPKAPSLANSRVNPSGTRTSPPSSFPRFLSGAPLKHNLWKRSSNQQNLTFPRFLSGAPLKHSKDLPLHLQCGTFPRFLSGAPLKPLGWSSRRPVERTFPRFLSGAPLKHYNFLPTVFSIHTFPRFLSGAPLKPRIASPASAQTRPPSLDSYLGLH